MELKEFIKERGEKFLISNSPEWENALLNLLAKDAYASFGVRALSLYDILKDFYLINIGEAKDILTEDESIIFIKEILNSIDLKHFKEELQSASLYSEILSILIKLRLSDCENLSNETLPSKEISRIYTAYDECLKRLNKYDLRRLIDKISPKDLKGHYAIFKDTLLHHREREFIKLIPNLKELDSMGGEHPKGVFASSNLPSPFTNQNLRFMTYESKEEEVRGVIEEIKGRYSPQEVEIRYFDSSYDTIIEGMSLAYGIDIKIEGVRSPHLSEFKRLIDLFKRLSIYNFNKSDMMALIHLFNIEIDGDFDFGRGRENFKTLSEFYRHLSELVPSDLSREVLYKDYLWCLIDFIKKYIHLDLYPLEKIYYSKEAERKMSYQEIFSEIEAIPSPSPLIHCEYPFIIASPITEYLPFRRKFIFILGMHSEVIILDESPILDDHELSLFSKNIMDTMIESDFIKYHIERLFIMSKGNLFLSYPQKSLKEDLKHSPNILWRKLNGTPKEVPYLTKKYFYKKDFTWTPLDREDEEKVIAFIKQYQFSQTSLKDLINCPQCFYYKRILGMRVEDEKEADFLDPLNKGNLVHKVLERAVLSEADKEQFNKILNDEIEVFYKLNPPNITHLAKRDIDKIKNSLNDYYDSHLSPYIKDFKNWRVEEIYRERLNTGNFIINFIAKMDRVEYGDKIKVVDYKTGSPKNLKQSARMGSLIQDSLYALLLGENTLSSYHFPLAEEKEMVWERGVSNPKELLKTIDNYLSLIKIYGFFPKEKLISPPEGFETLKIDEEEAMDSHRFLNTFHICGVNNEDTR